MSTDRPKRTVVKARAGTETTFTPIVRVPAATPARAGRASRPEPATRRDELARSCLYGDPCGCAVRKCYAPAYRSVTMAGDCKACLAGTVLAPGADRPGWDYTVAGGE